jgi:hypothetical protein
MLIMDRRAVEPRPVHVEQFDFRWPAESEMARGFHFRGMEYQYSLTIHRVWLERDADEGPRVRVSGSQSTSWRGSFGARADVSASMNAVADTGTERMSNGFLDGQARPFEMPLSVTPATPPRCYVMLLISRVSPDDPLPMVPVGQFIDANRKRIVQDGIFGQPNTVVMNDLWRAPAGGVRLGAYLMGITMLLLVAAAALLAQVFRRRDLAMVGLLLGVVLYIAAFDRALLSYDLSQIADRSGALQSRLVACSRIGSTFFYRHTALERLAAVESAEPNMPPLLLDSVNGVEGNLLRWWP